MIIEGLFVLIQNSERCGQFEEATLLGTSNEYQQPMFLCKKQAKYVNIFFICTSCK